MDSNVARYLFSHCLKGFLAGKTVVLVTHQIQFTRLCDHVYLMSDGTLTSQRPCQDILKDENRSGFPEQDDIRVRLVFNVLVN